MEKVAFFSMDVESYFDTSCVRKSGMSVDQKYNCAEDIQKYVHFLDKYGIKGTFFVVADFIPFCKEYLLEAIEHGHEIGLHCLHHDSFKGKNDEQFREEIIEAKRIVNEELGVEPVGFRFPRYEYNENQLKILKDLGFAYDSSQIKPKKDYIRITDRIYQKDGFYEFCPNTKWLPGKTIKLSGGGFLRFLPKKPMTSMIKKHIRTHDTFLVYFHPFEIHEGYLPVPNNILIAQKIYINKGRNTFLDFVEEILLYLKEQGYTFSNMKEYCLSHKNKE